jgi:hypothetical protein
MNARGISTIQPGDVLGFSACTPQGAIIRVCTGGLICCGGLSHIGFAVQWPGYTRPLLCESTSLCDLPCVVQGRRIKGVQLHYLRQRIATYPGRVWHYPLARPLSASEVCRLKAFCEAYLGVEYDRRGAIGARHTLFARLFQRPENLDKLFCSEWLVATMRYMRRFRTDNASAWSPRAARRVMLQDGECLPGRRIK